MMMRTNFKQIVLLILAIGLMSGLSAQSAKKMLKSGDHFFEVKQYKDAYDEYNKARELDPESYDAYLGMGLSLYYMDRREEAMEEFRRAAAFGQKEFEPFFYLGKIYADRGNWSEAANYLKKARDNDRKNENILAELFRAQSKTGQLEEALQTAEDLHKADRSAYNQYIIGVALDSLGRYKEAEENYREARFKDPKLTEAYIGVAHVRYEQGMYKEALEDCNKAIEKSPNNSAAFLMRSKTKIALKDFDGAISDLSAVLQENPDDVGVRWARAEAYQAMGQFDHSINDWTKILKLQPDNYKALYERASDYESTNDYQNAIKDYKYLRRLSPYDDNAAALLNDAQDRLFELNRETGLPDVEVTNYKINEYGQIEIPDNQVKVQIEGKVIDESPINSLMINDYEVTVTQDSINPHFSHIVDITGVKQIVLKATDVYGNQNQILYKVKLTEVSPPEVQLLAPYSSDDGTLSITGNISDVHIEGKVRDNSKINSIVINGVNASFISDQYNPKFSADVSIANSNFLSVVVEDEYGNRTEKKFEIKRDGAALSDDNPMGKTWVVFIENSNYQSFASIDGPVKDVNIMKQSFAGYHIHNVLHKVDMTKTEMERFFSIELRDLVRSNEVSSLLVWYAGHGKYINNTGYWIPVDADRDDEFSYFNINALKASMLAYSNYLNHTLVVTDACESGPSFAEITRDNLVVRRCDDWEAARMKSSQVFSSAGYELASDNSQFTRTFANMLSSNPNSCLPIERVVIKVRDVVKSQGKQSPKFGIIDGMGDEDGTFFFMRKTN